MTLNNVVTIFAPTVLSLPGVMVDSPKVYKARSGTRGSTPTPNATCH